MANVRPKVVIVMAKAKTKQTNPDNLTSGLTERKMTLRMEGTRPPIPAPLTQWPRYSGGNGLSKDETQPWKMALKVLTNTMPTMVRLRNMSCHSSVSNLERMVMKANVKTMPIWKIRVSKNSSNWRDMSKFKNGEQNCEILQYRYPFNLANFLTKNFSWDLPESNILSTELKIFVQLKHEE